MKKILTVLLLFFCVNIVFADNNIEEHHVNIGGHIVYYITDGDKDKDVILFLHGLFAEKEQWVSLMEYFSKKGFYTVALDLPGFGKSKGYPLSVYTVENEADLVKEFVDKLGFKNINLAGNSLGCAIAMAFTQKNKKNIKTLAFIGGPAGLGKWSSSAMKVYETGVNPFLPLTVDQFNEEISLLFFKPPKIPLKLIEDKVKEYKDNYTHYNSVFNICIMSLYSFTVNLNPDMNLPTFILWGKDDKILAAEDAGSAKKKIPGSKLVILGETGHLPMLENSKKTAEKYFEFLKRNE